ncbi:MAG: helix-turn-helix domain-containing protein [Bariatricus sp.]
MDSGYEKIKTEKQIPAVIAYLDKEAVSEEMRLGRPAYIPPHWHRSIEMSLVMEGSVELWIHEEKQIIREGEFIFVNSGSVHQIREGNAGDTAVMMVIISYEFLKKVYPDIDQMYFRLDSQNDEMERIKEIYAELKKYTQDPQPLDYIRINGYLYEIIYFLLTKCVVKDQGAGKKIKRVNHTQKKVLDFIDEHYREEITLKMMAETFEMSEEHFSRKFHRSFGISFKNYVDRYRIYQAFNDVIQSEKSMQQIAMEYGFPNIKSFIAHFKKEYGITPYQYRRTYQISRNDNFSVNNKQHEINEK